MKTLKITQDYIAINGRYFNHSELGRVSVKTSNSMMAITVYDKSFDELFTEHYYDKFDELTGYVNSFAKRDFSSYDKVSIIDRFAVSILDDNKVSLRVFKKGDYLPVGEFTVEQTREISELIAKLLDTIQGD